MIKRRRPNQKPSLYYRKANGTYNVYEELAVHYYCSGSNMIRKTGNKFFRVNVKPLSGKDSFSKKAIRFKDFILISNEEWSDIINCK